MSFPESFSNNKPNRNEHGTRGLLKRKWWLGIGAIVTTIGVIVTILTLIRGPDSSSDQTIRANDGNCVIQAGNGNRCSVYQLRAPRATSAPIITSEQSRLADCQVLAADANNEAVQLLTLKSTISIDDPTSRVTDHTSEFAPAYNRAFS